VRRESANPAELYYIDVLYVYSANTMSSCMEVLGMSLPYSSCTPAVYPGGHCDKNWRALLS
jgi:Dehydratase family